MSEHLHRYQMATGVYTIDSAAHGGFVVWGYGVAGVVPPLLFAGDLDGCLAFIRANMPQPEPTQ